uniref:Branched-chain-amino-acid aminotransferase n=1 Tax=Caenorhabditis japonica TaxID=281687 RepID=A0A8R1HUW5_CAEJA
MQRVPSVLLARSFHTTSAASSFQYADLIVEPSTKKQRLPSDPTKLGFGRYFSNHIIDIDWDMKEGWFAPKIKQFENFSLHPAAKVLHYAQEVFEGLKAYHGVDGKIRIFRPELNMERMRRSARRSALPDFDTREALLLIDELVRMDADLVPKTDQASLYIRPMMFATEPHIGIGESLQAKWACFSAITGSYFNYERGIKLLADPEMVRSWKGGVGQYKMGCNYAPTIAVGKMAALHECGQVMWLSGEDRLVTEAGAMNLFVLWTNEENDLELITPPTDSGLLLPGVTRLSVLELAKEWNVMKVSERNFTMPTLARAIREKRVHEFFVSGTAAIVGPVSEILYMDKEHDILEKLHIPTLTSKYQFHKRMHTALTDIHYGKVEKSEWQRIVEV